MSPRYRQIAQIVLASALLGALPAPVFASDQVVAEQGLTNAPEPSKLARSSICVPSKKCLLTSYLDGVSPVAGMLSAAFRAPNDEYEPAMEYIRADVKNSSETELDQIYEQAAQGGKAGAIAALDEYIATRAANHATRRSEGSAASSLGSGAPGAGVGGLLGSGLWIWNSGVTYTYNGFVVGHYDFEYRQYVSASGTYSKDASLYFDLNNVDGPGVQINGFSSVCREDRAIDRNCSYSPNLSEMLYFGYSYSTSSNYPTFSSDKMFLNLDWFWYVNGYGSNNWGIGTYTSYRWKCVFSAPVCQYTGAS